MTGFLQVQKSQLVHAGERVRLRGVNLGGWLMMEGYILHSLNQPEHRFKEHFARTSGAAALAEFEKEFRGHFIQEKDFELLAEWGFNCLRLPFNCRLIDLADPQGGEGIRYLDAAIRWAKKYKLWVILDLHAAWGAQNHDWHSDSNGEARLWHDPAAQKKTFALWSFLADRYRKEPRIAGYDLLNEAVVEEAETLNAFYRDLIREIRLVDRNHVIFVEGNKWATDLACLERFPDDQLALSIHFYEPLDYTFNYVPGLYYPLNGPGGGYNKGTMRQRMESYAALAARYEAPVLVGEFGVNARDGHYGEDQWLSDLLKVFDDLQYHWTYWTYKAVKNSIFPDGILSSRDNPVWVSRQGPTLGWDNYSRFWPEKKKEIILSWETAAFQPNSKILNVLKASFKKA